MKIYKYPLEITDRQIVMVPAGFTPLTVQVQNGQLCLWAEVGTTNWREEAVVYIVGTGHDVPKNVIEFHYIGTVQMGQFVWHVYWGRS